MQEQQSCQIKFSCSTLTEKQTGQFQTSPYQNFLNYSQYLNGNDRIIFENSQQIEFSEESKKLEPQNELFYVEDSVKPKNKRIQKKKEKAKKLQNKMSIQQRFKEIKKTDQNQIQQWYKLMKIEKQFFGSDSAKAIEFQQFELEAKPNQQIQNNQQQINMNFCLFEQECHQQQLQMNQYIFQNNDFEPQMRISSTFDFLEFIYQN